MKSSLNHCIAQETGILCQVPTDDWFARLRNQPGKTFANMETARADAEALAAQLRGMHGAGEPRVSQ